MPMIFELLIATLLVLFTVGFHGAGIFCLSSGLEKLAPARKQLSRRQQAAGATFLILGLLAITTIEIWAYALFYVSTGAVADLRTAVYFSTVSFATLGFSDDAIIDDWKLVGAIEGINGALLVGWSVAFLVSEASRHLPRRHD